MGLYQIIEKLGLLVVGAAIGHFLTKDREKSRDSRNAKREFREAFTNAIDRLENGNESDRFILKEEFPRHKQAFSKYLPFVSKLRRSSFIRSWEKYKNHYDERTQVGIIEMLGTEINNPNALDMKSHIKKIEKDRSKQALELICEILSFAN